MTASVELPGAGAPGSERVAARDTDATTFTAILGRLRAAVPGCIAVVLFDPEGETVDYTGRGDPFDLRVAAAHLQLLLRDLEALDASGTARWLAVRGRRKSVAATVLPDGYGLGLLLRSRSAFSVSSRAISACVHELCAEAGWKAQLPAPGARAWFPVDVTTDRRGRPRTIGPEPVEVLGAVVGLSRRERGFRVRTSKGNELTLVREPRQRWYADERV